MSQTITIRRQMLAALDRVRSKLDDDYKHRSVVDKCWIELCDEFAPDAVAIGPSQSFESLAAILGCVKLAPDAILTTQSEMDCIKWQFAELEAKVADLEATLEEAKLQRLAEMLEAQNG